MDPRPVSAFPLPGDAPTSTPRGLSGREAPASADDVAVCRATLEAHSKSFALAGRLLPARCRDDAAVTYAWCRHADDAIDERPLAEAPEALATLRAELDAVYGDAPLEDVTLRAFRTVTRRRNLPRQYPEELLAGMAMDAADTRYETLDDLLLYCHRVAGVVGLMMCHVLGVREDAALRHAAQLGMGMQLTNIARDVLEDWDRGRLYLPRSWLAEEGAADLPERLGGPFPDDAAAPVARVVARLLALADELYRVGDEGTAALSTRTAFAIVVARLVYSAIGTRVAAQDCDVRRGRAVVPTHEKLRLVGAAAARSLASLPDRLSTRLRGAPAATRPPSLVARYPNDIL